MKKTWIGLLMLTLAALACNLPLPGQSSEVDVITAPTSMPGAVQIMVGEGGSIEGALQQIEDLGAGAQFEVTVTEAQLESEINEAVTSDGLSETVGYVDVGLTDTGLLTLSFPFDASVAGMNGSGTAYISFTVSVQDGVVLVHTVESTISVMGVSVGLPDALVSTLNEEVASALTDLQTGAQGQVQIESVTIYAGALHISGTVLN